MKFGLVKWNIVVIFDPNSTQSPYEVILANIELWTLSYIPWHVWYILNTLYSAKWGGLVSKLSSAYCTKYREKVWWVPENYYVGTWWFRVANHKWMLRLTGLFRKQVMCRTCRSSRPMLGSYASMWNSGSEHQATSGYIGANWSLDFLTLVA